MLEEVVVGAGVVVVGGGGGARWYLDRKQWNSGGNWRLREDLSEQVTFIVTPEGCKEVNHINS